VSLSANKETLAPASSPHTTVLLVRHVPSKHTNGQFCIAIYISWRGKGGWDWTNTHQNNEVDREITKQVWHAGES
jgi:hypothetical protein